MSAVDRLRALSAPHVCRSKLVAVETPRGWRYFHDGAGTLEAMGWQWEGVNSPTGSQVVSIGPIRRPRLGQAPVVDILIAAARPGFMQQYWDDRASWEGAACNIYYRTQDQEVGTEIIAPKLQFPGRLTSGRITRTGHRNFTLAFRVESLNSSQNFPASEADWSMAGQQARYPGDLLFSEINNPIKFDLR